MKQLKVSKVRPDENPADMFTKVLGRQVFEKYRKWVMNSSADRGVEANRQPERSRRIAGVGKNKTDRREGNEFKQHEFKVLESLQNSLKQLKAGI